MSEEYNGTEDRDQSGPNLDQLNAAVSSPRQRFQYMVLILLALNYFPLVFNHVIMAFYGSAPPYVCHVTALGKNSTASVKYQNVTVLEEVGDKCESTLYLEDNKNITVSCGKGQWTFNPEFGETTIVSAYKKLASLATTIYFCGVMVGGLFFGYVSDTVGRLPVLLLTLYLPIALGVGISFVQSYLLFVILRFIQGLIIQGLQNATYILAMEFFVPAQRPLVGSVMEGTWGFAVMTLAGLAYLLKDWRYLQLAISVPSALAFFYICVMPESLRWMVMKGKLERAEKLVVRITEFNQISFPTELWENVRAQAAKATSSGTYHFLHLVKTPQLRKRTLIACFLWLTVSTCYYGLTFMITSLPGNKYMNFFIGGAVEFVAYISSLWVMNKFGHKTPMTACFIGAGICCIIAAAIPAAPSGHGVDIDVMSTTFAIIGRFFVAGLFAVIFVYTTTLYPTVIRNIGMGSCLFWARLGGVIAPQINELDSDTKVLVPILVFGVLTLVAGMMMVWMPETHRQKMPDTIDDVEHPQSTPDRGHNRTPDQVHGYDQNIAEDA